MSELVLVCHGQPDKYRTFELPEGFTIYYIGTPGEPLAVKHALKVVQMLQSDPTDLERVADIVGQEVESVSGKKTIGPDFDLGGDDRLPTGYFDLINRKKSPLKDDWESTLKKEVRSIYQNDTGNNNLYLLCCWAL